jgi:uncharacterized linocin/CFP29 family protein
MPQDNVQMDLLSDAQGGMSGVGARLLAANFNPQALRTNATLRRDEWVHFDNTVIDIARQRMIGVADLLSRGLVYNLPNALGKTEISWERISDMDPAEVSMAGVTEGRNDRLLFDTAGMPIPIVHKDFHLNVRHLAASRSGGTPLDTTQVAVATRLVTERIENILFNGTNAAGTTRPVYGYLTAPQRNVGSVTATWLSATGEQILGDVLAMVGKAVDDNMYGPYVLYVSNAVFTKLGADFKAGSDRSILERILAVPGIEDVRAVPFLTGTNLLLIQMTSDVVDIVVGFQPMVLQWDTMGGLVQNFKVMAIMVPRIKADYTGQSGIVHYS